MGGASWKGGGGGEVVNGNQKKIMRKNPSLVRNVTLLKKERFHVREIPTWEREISDYIFSEAVEFESLFLTQLNTLLRNYFAFLGTGPSKHIKLYIRPET